VKGALVRYRVMAYVVGTLLIVLCCIGVPLKYLATDGTTPQHIGRFIAEYLGILHGFLYMGFVLVAADLARRARFPLAFAALILVLGTVPFFTFVAERMTTHRVRMQYPELQTGADPSPAPG
jgi:integral membrane protein